MIRLPAMLARPMFGIAASGRPLPISLSAARAAWIPAPWLAPIAATPRAWRRSAASLPEAGERLRACVEGEHRQDGERRDAPHRFDRGHELVELEEGLDREEVDAAALEHLGLLGEELLAFVCGNASFAERADRAGDEDVAPGDLARLAGELDAGAVDLVKVVLQVARGELAPVGAEGVRLDQVGAGLDEADVELDDGLGRAEVGLFGDAGAGGGARDEDAHAAVGDEGRPVGEAFEEAVGHRRSLLSAPGRGGRAGSGDSGHLHRSRR